MYVILYKDVLSHFVYNCVSSQKIFLVTQLYFIKDWLLSNRLKYIFTFEKDGALRKQAKVKTLCMIVSNIVTISGL